MMVRRICFGTLASLAAIIIVFVSLSIVLSKISNLRRDTDFRVQITSVDPNIKKKEQVKIPKPESRSNKAKKPAEVKVAQKKEAPKPEKKKKPAAPKIAQKAARPRQQLKGRNMPAVTRQPALGGPMTGEINMPAINVYYGKKDIYEYMQALAYRNCIVLVRSPLGKLFAGYNPLTGTVKSMSIKELSGYSPRVRVLAEYGENPVTDRIIEKAVMADVTMAFPDGCRLISLWSQNWETTLMTTVKRAADTKGIVFDEIDYAEATFYQKQFAITKIITSTGIELKVNFTL